MYQLVWFLLGSVERERVLGVGGSLGVSWWGTGCDSGLGVVVVGRLNGDGISGFVGQARI